MPPIDLQPIERLEKPGAWRLPEQIRPNMAKLGKPANVVNLGNLEHGQVYDISINMPQNT
jgi:hypothetical protein